MNKSKIFVLFVSLNRYGNACFLDATYRTTKYALPIFFLAVKTNVGYSVVGEFIVDTEARAAIRRGLQTIKDWMAADDVSWNPHCFLTDFCEREISAIEDVFPGEHISHCIQNKDVYTIALIDFPYDASLSLCLPHFPCVSLTFPSLILSLPRSPPYFFPCVS